MEIKTNIADVIRQLETYRNTLNDRMRLFMEKLADLGLYYAEWSFGTAEYDGDKDVSVSVEWESDTRIRIVAKGQSVAFIEFGTGPYGFGHPDAARLGMGPGTWSDGPNGKGHWQQPWGWFYKDESGETQHSYGNVASESMSGAAKDMREKIADIAREVFQND